MTFTLKKNPVHFDYHIDQTILPKQELINDLGVMFDTRLSFSQHVQNVTCDAYKILGFVMRSTRDFASLGTIQLLYNVFVRSKLEYASIVWCPGYSVHIDGLERVQRKLLKFLIFKEEGVYPTAHDPQSALLSRFSFSSLDQRRNLNALLFLRKIILNIIDCPSILGKLNFSIPGYNSRSTYTFYLPTATINVVKFSPLYFMCDLCNKYCRHIDIFHCTAAEIKRLYA